jgi:hypothetical protein
VVSVNLRPLTKIVVLAGLLVVPAVMTPTASAATGATTRVSTTTGGTQGNGACFSYTYMG